MKIKIVNAYKLLFDQLRDLYSMEVQLCESMNQLMSFCTNEELRNLLHTNAHQNGNQIMEIASIFDRLGESLGSDKSKAVAGLIESGAARLETTQSLHARDLMLATHCLRTGHYQMAAYQITTLLSGRLGLMREPLILSELLADEMDMTAALMQLEPDLFRAAKSNS